MSGKLKKIIWNDKEMGTLVCGLQELEGLQYLKSLKPKRADTWRKLRQKKVKKILSSEKLLAQYCICEFWPLVLKYALLNLEYVVLHTRGHILQILLSLTYVMLISLQSSFQGSR